ncbi:MAG: class I SAM-dependent methyltransferase [Ilumatobacteraceae bacterium]
MDNEALWERHAAWWQREFTAGADAEYDDLILPLVERRVQGARRVLDIGCGEGQVARRIAGVGALAVGLDPTASQVATARRRAGGPAYARARAEALPGRSGSFDTGVVCLALQPGQDLVAAIGEVARVLEPRGPFVVVQCHP